MFLQMWNITEISPVFPSVTEDTGYTPDTPSGYVMPYSDYPLDGERVGETVYMVAVSGLPKQGEAERVFRNRLDEIARERAGK